MLKKGDIFFHYYGKWSGENPEAIWLVVEHDGIEKAFSLWSGEIVKLGSGTVHVFNHVDFLDLDVTKRPCEMRPGEVFMSASHMVIKSEKGRFYSLNGTLIPAIRNQPYQMMEIHVGMGNAQMKSIKDYHLTR